MSASTVTHSRLPRTLAPWLTSMAVLCCALTDLARRDQQYFLRALKRSFKQSRIGVVGLADLNAQSGEIGSSRRIAHGGDNLAGRQFIEQRLDDESAKLAVAPVMTIMEVTPVRCDERACTVSDILTFRKYAPGG